MAEMAPVCGSTVAVAAAPAPFPPMVTAAFDSVNGLLAQFDHGPK